MQEFSLKNFKMISEQNNHLRDVFFFPFVIHFIAFSLSKRICVFNLLFDQRLKKEEIRMEEFMKERDWLRNDNSEKGKEIYKLKFKLMELESKEIISKEEFQNFKDSQHKCSCQKNLQPHIQTDRVIKSTSIQLSDLTDFQFQANADAPTNSTMRVQNEPQRSLDQKVQTSQQLRSTGKLNSPFKLQNNIGSNQQGIIPPCMISSQREENSQNDQESTDLYLRTNSSRINLEAIHCSSQSQQPAHLQRSPHDVSKPSALPTTKAGQTASSIRYSHNRSGSCYFGVSASLTSSSSLYQSGQQAACKNTNAQSSQASGRIPSSTSYSSLSQLKSALFSQQRKSSCTVLTAKRPIDDKPVLHSYTSSISSNTCITSKRSAQSIHSPGNSQSLNSSASIPNINLASHCLKSTSKHKQISNITTSLTPSALYNKENFNLPSTPQTNRDSSSEKQAEIGIKYQNIMTYDHPLYNEDPYQNSKGISTSNNQVNQIKGPSMLYRTGKTLNTDPSNNQMNHIKTQSTYNRTENIMNTDIPSNNQKIKGQQIQSYGTGSNLNSGPTSNKNKDSSMNQNLLLKGNYEQAASQISMINEPYNLGSRPSNYQGKNFELEAESQLKTIRKEGTDMHENRQINAKDKLNPRDSFAFQVQSDGWGAIQKGIMEEDDNYMTFSEEKPIVSFNYFSKKPGQLQTLVTPIQNMQGFHNGQLQSNNLKNNGESESKFPHKINVSQENYIPQYYSKVSNMKNNLPTDNSGVVETSLLQTSIQNLESNIINKYVINANKEPGRIKQHLENQTAQKLHPSFIPKTSPNQIPQTDGLIGERLFEQFSIFGIDQADIDQQKSGPQLQIKLF